jgi:hypothetical protein
VFCACEVFENSLRQNYIKCSINEVRFKECNYFNWTLYIQPAKKEKNRHEIIIPACRRGGSGQLGGGVERRQQRSGKRGGSTAAAG